MCWKGVIDKWRPPSLSELTPYWIPLGLTHLGSEVSKWIKKYKFFVSHKKYSKSLLNHYSLQHRILAFTMSYCKASNLEHENKDETWNINTFAFKFGVLFDAFDFLIDGNR